MVEIVKQAARLGPSLPEAESRRRLGAIVENDPEADAIVDRLGSLFGVGSGPGGRDEIFWAVRRLLQALARERPVVVVFDDVHWGEQTFLDLVDHITDWARDTRILLICLARGELLEERPTWAGGKLNATSLLLEPLADEACGTLIENLLDRTEVASEVKERISRSAEGNPLFVEELLAMLIDEGALQRDDGRWVATTDLSSLAVPPTIQALLDARLDRLPAPERNVLERAAIAGKIFSRSAVRVLSPPDEHSFLADRLDDLVRKQLIRPHQTEFGRENTYRFRHALIRDAAYRQMPKAARADLHERFARWLEGAGGPRSAEQEEILGYHLEQAHRFRRELGGPTAAGDALARRGAACLASAGRRAISRGDMAAAAGLLTRAQLLLARRGHGLARVRARARERADRDRPARARRRDSVAGGRAGRERQGRESSGAGAARAVLPPPAHGRRRNHRRAARERRAGTVCLREDRRRRGTGEGVEVRRSRRVDALPAGGDGGGPRALARVCAARRRRPRAVDHPQRARTGCPPRPATRSGRTSRVRSDPRRGADRPVARRHPLHDRGRADRPPRPFRRGSRPHSSKSRRCSRSWPQPSPGGSAPVLGRDRAAGRRPRRCRA